MLCQLFVTFTLVVVGLFLLYHNFSPLSLKGGTASMFSRFVPEIHSSAPSGLIKGQDVQSLRGRTEVGEGRFEGSLPGILEEGLEGEEGSEKFPSLLVVVRTQSQEYSGLVRRIRETWGGGAAARMDQRVRFVGDVPGDGQEDMFAAECGERGPLNKCCKTYNMIELAYNITKRELFDWVYLVDDDTYLLLDNIQRSYGVPTGPALLGIYGCVHENVCGGICGGGGILMSRQLLPLLMEAPGQNHTSFRDELTSKCQECGLWDDLAVTELVEARRNSSLQVDMRDLTGAHGWQMSENELLISLHSTRPLVTMYHYNARNEMEKIHQKVQEIKTNEVIPERQRPKVLESNL